MIELKTNWVPKLKGHNLPWKVTKSFTSPDGESVHRIEKYQGGRNSPALVTEKHLRAHFTQQP